MDGVGAVLRKHQLVRPWLRRRRARWEWDMVVGGGAVCCHEGERERGLGVRAMGIGLFRAGLVFSVGAPRAQRGRGPTAGSSGEQVEVEELAIGSDFFFGLFSFLDGGPGHWHTGTLAH